MKRTLLLATLASCLWLAPATASAQSAPVRVVFESVGGVGGASVGGLVGVALGLGLSSMLNNDKLEPVLPMVGAFTGASVGTVAGVMLTGTAVDSNGKFSGAALGFAGGAALTAAGWGLAAAFTRTGRNAYLWMALSALVPIVSSAVGYEISGGWRARSDAP